MVVRGTGSRRVLASCLVPMCIAISTVISYAQVGDDWHAAIEADWLNQEQVRWNGATAGITTAMDAQGACDGVKNGKWGFHTNAENDPWWQVDLGEVKAVDHVLVYNRCDAPDRAAHLRLLTSDDGTGWTQVYEHDGTVFLGAPDGKPLTIALTGVRTRYVRIQLPGQAYLHFDEVEVYGPEDPERNLALWQPCDQSSVSPWSARHAKSTDPVVAVQSVIRQLERCRRLADAVADVGVDVSESQAALAEAETGLNALPADAGAQQLQDLYLSVRWIGRRLEFASPLLDFDKLVFIKRVPGSYPHMSDQHYGWWSRPGGGLWILEGLRSDQPVARQTPVALPEGSLFTPELSYDGTKVLFAHCAYHDGVAANPDKMHKENLPEDAFYHIFEVNIDGTGLQQLTFGRYDDFDPRYLPSGDIVFLSTRRGTFLECGQSTAMATLTSGALPDSYVRCGGDPYRPVAVYTLHVMNADGGDMRTISPFENFEWTPSVTSDGRIIYARWDYVDRSNMPFMSLWSTSPDGMNTQIVYGNFTRDPHCVFEAKSIPGSDKLMFTGSAHHAMTGGSIVLLDPRKGMDDEGPITRLTPEVCFPEAEGWPETYYNGAYPLSEWQFLAAWSNKPLLAEGGTMPENAMGLYLCDAFGGVELLHRDPNITSMYPIPLRPRPMPPAQSERIDWAATPRSQFLLMDVYQGLPTVARGQVKALRVVGLPAKTHPVMNNPSIGLTGDDPGKVVLGTVPVGEDGSAYFSVPSGLPVFFQALDESGMALRTMRTAAYTQPGETQACIGCHESRLTAPPNALPVAGRGAPVTPTPGPDGTWPMRYDRLVQPVLDRSCVQCHRPDGPDPKAVGLNLTAEVSYDTLVNWGSPSIRELVVSRYQGGVSNVGDTLARTSPLLPLLTAEGGHHGITLSPEDRERLVTWLDVYAQRAGSFSEEQERQLVELRESFAGLRP